MVDPGPVDRPRGRRITDQRIGGTALRPSKPAPAILGMAVGDFRRSAVPMICYGVLFRLVSFAVIAPVIS